MRNDLEEIGLIDRWLFCRLGEAEAGTFEARLLVDEPLAEKVAAQRTAHRIVHRYARAKERGRLEAIFRQLCNEQDFTLQLHSIFT